jgi:predicted anti-sigma-YlaC factor YlaD
MNCYDAIDLMGVALEGRVPESSRPGFDDHLVECPPCRSYFAQLEVTVRALGRLPHHPVTAPDPALRARLLAQFRDRNPGSDA